MTLNEYQTAYLFRRYAEAVKLLNVFSEKEIQQFENFLVMKRVGTEVPTLLVLDVIMSIQWGLRRVARSEDAVFYYRCDKTYESRFLYSNGSQILPPEAILAPYVRSYKKTYVRAYHLVLDLLNDLLPKVIIEDKGLFFKGIVLSKIDDNTFGFQFRPISLQDKSLLWIP